MLKLLSCMGILKKKFICNSLMVLLRKEKKTWFANLKKVIVWFETITQDVVR